MPVCRRPLVFHRRARLEENHVAVRRVWLTQCDCCRVVHSTIPYGRTDGKGYPDRYYAQRKAGKNKWANLSIHRKLKTAMLACLQHHRRTQPTPAPELQSSAK